MAQTYSFRNFNVEDGVSHPFIYDMVQDNNGYLWVATGEGLCKFNGFSFTNYFVADGLSENFISTLYLADSGRLWMGHNQGGVTYYENGSFHIIETASYFKSTVRAIREDYSGNTWIVSQHGGVLKIRRDGQIEHFETPFAQLLLFDMQITERGQMLVATNEGLYMYMISDSLGHPEFEKIIDEVPPTRVNCISYAQVPGKFLIGTEDEGVFQVQVRTNNRVTTEAFMPSVRLNQHNIQTILHEDAENLWIGSFGSGLLHINGIAGNQRVEKSWFDEKNGLGSNDVKSLFRDREGNIWVGKFGGNHNAGGISSLSNNAFLFYDHPSVDDGAFYSVHGRDGMLCAGLKNAVMQVDSSRFNQATLYNSSHGLPECLYTAIFIDSNYNIWAGSAQNGLLFKPANDTMFTFFELSKDRLSLGINDITGNENYIWVATKNGIYEIGMNDHSIRHYSKEDGIEHNVIKSLYLDEKNNLWYSTASSYLSYLKEGKIVNIMISEDLRVHDQTAITKDLNGNIWLATNGSGIFIFDYESIKTINAQSHGLKSNFCYTVQIDQNNKVWVGHKGGLSCYNPTNDQLQVFDQSEGMAYDFIPNAVYKDKNGELWMGTNKKLLRYNASKDIHNSIAPIINIQEIRIEDELHTNHEIELPYGKYRTRFDFLGLSFRHSDKVTYQYKLDGYDRDWHAVTHNTHAYYSRLDPGSYVFRVVAFNSDGIQSTVPAEVRIHIEKPIWEKGWFIGLSGLAFVVLVTSLIKLRDRRQRLVRQYLKKTLEERTMEVRAKSVELQQKNKDITSSIHYAKKIQDATLPDQEKLKDHFPNSFVFYKPRDIISGDFYWFKHVDNKLIVSIADCTGHGVPGALLSMIGSTKMNDIVLNASINRPDEIMRKLDEELQQVLKQTATSNSPQDGMDMALCEINLDTQKVRICSAMSNIYIASSSGVEKVQSDRNSIGGSISGQNKSFSLFERQMLPGETLYMASDGYQDQFGGEQGKKLKRSGFTSFLQSICHQPGDVQYTSFEQHFTSWKGDLEQIDDVLVVGLKF